MRKYNPNLRMIAVFIIGFFLNSTISPVWATKQNSTEDVEIEYYGNSEQPADDEVRIYSYQPKDAFVNPKQSSGKDEVRPTYSRPDEDCFDPEQVTDYQESNDNNIEWNRQFQDTSSSSDNNLNPKKRTRQEADIQVENQETNIQIKNYNLETSERKIVHAKKKARHRGCFGNCVDRCLKAIGLRKTEENEITTQERSPKSRKWGRVGVLGMAATNLLTFIIVPITIGAGVVIVLFIINKKGLVPSINPSYAVAKIKEYLPTDCWDRSFYWDPAKKIVRSFKYDDRKKIGKVFEGVELAKKGIASWTENVTRRHIYDCATKWPEFVCKDTIDHCTPPPCVFHHFYEFTCNTANVCATNLTECVGKGYCYLANSDTLKYCKDFVNAPETLRNLNYWLTGVIWGTIATTLLELVADGIATGAFFAIYRAYK